MSKILINRVGKTTSFFSSPSLSTANFSNVEFVDGRAPRLCYNQTNLTKVTGLDDNITNLYYAFYNTNALITKLPSKLENANDIFYNCIRQTKFPALPNSVREISSAFYNCQNMTTFNGIIPPNVNFGEYTFDNCWRLTRAAQIDNRAVNIKTYCWYYNCVNLTDPGYIPAGVTNTYGMFAYCNKLASHPIVDPNQSDWSFFHMMYNTSVPRVTNFANYGHIKKLYGYYSNCNYNGTSITLPPNVESISYLFYGQGTAFQNIPTIPNSVKDMYYTFYNCRNLRGDINISAPYLNDVMAFSYCTNMNSVSLKSNERIRLGVPNCYNLKSIKVDAPRIWWLDASYCYNLTSLNTPDFDGYTGWLHSLNYCYNITNFATNVVNTQESGEDPRFTFAECYNLKTIDINAMKLNMIYCYNCYNLTHFNSNTLYVKLNNSANSFYNCSNLKSIPSMVPSYIAANMFYNCRNLTAPKLSFTYCSNLYNAFYMSGIQYLDLSTYKGATFNLAHSIGLRRCALGTTTDINNMFYNCTNLLAPMMIDPCVTNMYQSFYNCVNFSGNLFVTSTEIINAASCFYSTSNNKNVFIPFKYPNTDEYTKTYNTFIAAGYSTSTRVNGVLLSDLYGANPSGDWKYRQMALNYPKNWLAYNVAIIYNYTGSAVNLTVPNYPAQTNQNVMIDVRCFKSNVENINFNNVRIVPGSLNRTAYPNLNSVSGLGNVMSCLTGLFDNSSVANINGNIYSMMPYSMNNAFRNCTNLTSIGTVHSSSSNWYNTFENDTNLLGVDLSIGVDYSYVQNSYPYRYINMFSAFKDCSNLDYVNISLGRANAGTARLFMNNAFDGCTNLKTVVFDMTNCSLQTTALSFVQCPNLSDLYIDGTMLSTFPNRLFEGSRRVNVYATNIAYSRFVNMGYDEYGSKENVYLKLCTSEEWLNKNYDLETINDSVYLNNYRGPSTVKLPGDVNE